MNPQYKIAIIEDDVAISQMYRLKFESEGFAVQTAENGEIGLKLIKDFQPNIVLLDIQMPVLDGAGALAQLRKEPWGKDIPVIILTNVGEEEAPRELEHLGVHSYIVKAELTPRQVTERVKAILVKS